jgi:peptidoglycan-associated lipoprotein
MSKQLMIFGIFLWLLIGISTKVISQTKNTRSGDNAYDRYQYQTALEYYKKGLKEVSSDAVERDRVTKRIADIYFVTNDWKNAILYFKRLEKNGYLETNPGSFLKYAISLQYLGFDSLAVLQYDKYLQFNPADSIVLHKKNDMLVLPKTLENSKFEIENAATINSSDDDFGLVFANRNEKEVIFTSNRKGSTGKDTDQWTNAPFTDLFKSELKSDGKFTKVEPADNQGILNTKAHEGVSSFNDNYSSIYCTRCEQKPQKKAGNIWCYIIKSNKSGIRWTKSEIVFTDQDGNAGQPSISEDELIMIFSGSNNKGFGGKDLWIAKRDSKRKPFGQPVNLGNRINTTGDEMFPYFRNDSILYFASDGHGGYGGLDIYKSTKNANGEWSAPKNIGNPINSFADDFSIVFKKDSEEGFFSSNRPEGKGGDDIYQFKRTNLKFKLTGHIQDALSLLPLVESTVLLVQGKDTISTKTDQNGEYKFDNKVLTQNLEYDIVARNTAYFSQKQSISTIGLKDDHQWKIDFNMVPIPETPIVLPQILYALDSWELLPQYQDSLLNLVVILNDNPDIRIELRSHTDSRATDKYNDELSQKRAQTVVDFLIVKGIDANRLQAKGLGKRSPRITETDFSSGELSIPAGTTLDDSYLISLKKPEWQEIVHQLNRRTEFSVISKSSKK